MAEASGRFFHVEVLVDQAALHDLMLQFDELNVFNVQVRAVRPEMVSKAARRVAVPIPGQVPVLEQGPRKGRAVQERILEFMNEHAPGVAVRNRAIFERVGGHRGSVDTALYLLAKQGTLVRQQVGFYARPK